MSLNEPVLSPMFEQDGAHASFVEILPYKFTSFDLKNFRKRPLLINDG